jgi:hypothetical protein
MTMRQLKYLNVILTVNAVLLTGLLWTQIASQPVLTGEANAQTRTQRSVPTIPNAAEQRKRMIDGLQDVAKTTAELQRLLQSGEIKVQVTNLDEITIETGG